jgi:hypothetical protein
MGKSRLAYGQREVGTKLKNDRQIVGVALRGHPVAVLVGLGQKGVATECHPYNITTPSVTLRHVPYNKSGNTLKGYYYPQLLTGASADF